MLPKLHQKHRYQTLYLGYLTQRQEYDILPFMMKNKLVSKTISVVFGIVIASSLIPVSDVAAQGSSPSISTNLPSNVSINSVTLQGSVNPNGSSTNAWFEYGPTASSLVYVTTAVPIGFGNSSSSFSMNISNLSASNIYYYRAVAQSGFGTSQGTILNFTTQPNQIQQFQSGAPVVTTNSISWTSPTSVTMYGSANPNNSSGATWFQYGPTQSLGSATPYSFLASGNSYANFSDSILNLSPNSTYYYRAVAQNGYATSYGTILAFTTSGGTQTVATTTNNTSTDLSGISNSLGKLSSSLVSLNAIVGNLKKDNANSVVESKAQIVSSTNGSKLANLTFTADKETLDPGDNIVFKVEVDPLTNLTDAILQVKLHSGLEFEGTNESSFARSENVLTYNLGNLFVDNAQVVKINARLQSDFKKGNAGNDAIKSTATLSYGDGNGSFRTPLFSSLETKVGTSGLFASILNVFPFGNGITILLIAFLVLLVAVTVKKLLS